MILTWVFYISLTFLTVFLFKYIGRAKEYNIKLGEKNILNFNMVTFIIFFLLLFFSVFRTIRGTIGGTDAYAYLEMFWDANKDMNMTQYISSFSLTELFNKGEPLFRLYNMVLRSLTASSHVYLAVTYGIIIAGIIAFVKNFYKETTYHFSLILVMCAYIYSFNIMRTWISIALCLWSFLNMTTNRWVKAFILILLAGLIHYMAFAFVLVWVICYMYNRKPEFFSCKVLLLIAITANMLCFLANAFIKGIVMSTKYAFYEKLFETNVSVIGYLPGIAICLAAIILFKNDSPLLMVDEVENRKKTYIILALTVNLSLTYLIIWMYAWRINDYYMLFRMYALSLIYEYGAYYAKRYGRIFESGVFAFTIVYYIQQMLGLKESSGVFPYILSFFE